MHKKKVIFTIIVSVCIFMQTSASQAYRLPRCPVAANEENRPAEDNLAYYERELSDLGNRSRIAEHSRNIKIRLTRAERADSPRFKELNVKIDFWNRVVRLKKSLLSLSGAVKDSETILEADVMARIVIETLYKASEEYDIAGSALIQNFLINMGVRKKGFCYHYSNDIRKALSAREWNRFDIRWGTAWGGDFRENNAIVITSKGMPFDTGIAIDAWRTASKPFWTKVKGDRFPWVEEFGVVLE